jgi:alkanesulfonate monooxygenase SsuD/methylene tetrahydromethanopterin reductase-like flavin-dependent oxidoreductase (luciferase family)
MPGRFFLGLGTGENLNEHIVGRGWPETEVRQERLEEAIEVIRQLWRGGNQSHHGRHFTVENARLYSLPDARPLSWSPRVDLKARNSRDGWATA